MAKKKEEVKRKRGRPRKAEDASKVLEEKELKREVLALVDSLNSQENKVIKWRFGLGDKNNLTLEEIGNRLGISRERVRQIQNNALKKLRNSSKTMQLKNYLYVD